MNHKGLSASVSAKHSYLRKHFGKPTHCTNPECEKRSSIFEWCKKTESQYTHNPDDYLWLCRPCHRRYDLTPEKKARAIENLWWSRNIKNPGVPNVENLWWQKDNNKMKKLYEKRKLGEGV